MPHDGWHGPAGAGPHHLPPGAGRRRRWLLAAAALFPFARAGAQAADAAQRIAEQALRLLAGLDEAQRRQILLAFDAAERLDWHYVPRRRAGLALGAMQPAQAQAARALCATVLNEQGLRLLDGVRLLEGVLREQQGSWRDPDNYVLTIFGTPGAFPWGWRFEGHHLSLNVALPTPAHVAVTPFFVGAHPATVRHGPHAGFRLLGEPEDLARRLMTGLPPTQQRLAVIADRAFDDIVASPQRERELGQPRGLEVAALDAAGRALVERIMDGFLATLASDLAAAQRRRVREQSLDRFRFAYAGARQPGEAYYFRLHGPATVIEHDNIQNDANHIHSVWRDLAADFGHDALAEHYRRQPHR